MTTTIQPLRVNGIELDVLRRGSGHPILLLHGPTPVSPDAAFLDLLAEHGEVIAPSAPGFGNSQRPENFDSLYDLVHLYQDVLDQIPGDQVTLIGLSFGGWLAAEVAVNDSHRLDQLILVDPLGIKVSGREERDIAHVFNLNPEEINRRAWADAANHPAGTGFGWQTKLDELSDEQMVSLAKSWDALSLYGWRPYMYNPNLPKWLHRVSVPTLILWGEQDQMVSDAYKAAYPTLIPGATSEVIPGAGHHPEAEQPQAFVARVAAFLKRGAASH